jgi:hypothetical protein
MYRSGSRMRLEVLPFLGETGCSVTQKSQTTRILPARHHSCPSSTCKEWIVSALRMVT